MGSSDNMVEIISGVGSRVLVILWEITSDVGMGIGWVIIGGITSELMVGVNEW